MAMRLDLRRFLSVGLRAVLGNPRPTEPGPAELSRFFSFPDEVPAEILFNDTNRHTVAVVAGNGPSLNRTDFTRLAGLPLFVCNNAHRIPSLIALRPSHWVWADPLKMWNDDVVSAMRHADDETAFYVTRAPLESPLGIDNGRIVRVVAKRALLDASSYPIPAASLSTVSDVRSFYSVRHSPMLAIQVALLHGYKRIVLIGLEHDYALRTLGSENLYVRHAYEESLKEIEPLIRKTILHFAEETRKTWGMYASLRNLAAVHGAIIVDATPSGLLDVFPRMQL